jgi:hypothetical protein
MSSVLLNVMVQSTFKTRLQKISIASKCRESWKKMEGEGAVRDCARCQSKVYNLSEMSETEAEALLARSEDICVRLYRRRDGTIVTADCRPVPSRQRLAVLSIATAFSMASVGAVATVAMAPSQSDVVEVAMGMGSGHFMKARVVKPESRSQRRAAKRRLRKALRKEGIRGSALRQRVKIEYNRDLRRRRMLERREKRRQRLNRAAKPAESV